MTLAGMIGNLAPVYERDSDIRSVRSCDGMDIT